MAILAIHDATGVIAAVVTCDSRPHPVLELPPGCSMTEVEPPEDLAGIDLRTSAGVTRLAHSYRVELSPTLAASLVAR